MAKSDNGDINNRLQTSDNNDPNNSFMKKVTSRVSSILPTSLSKWFGETGRTRQVIRRRDENQDDDDNQQQNDDTTTDYITQPPRKRPRNTDTLPSCSVNNFHSTPIQENTYNQFYAQGNSTPINIQKNQELSINHRQIEQDRQLQNQFHKDELITNVPINNHVHVETDVQINGDDRSDSGESTSGYSSVPVHNAQKESSLTSDRDSNKHDMNTSKILNVKSPVTPTRSLFSEQSLTPQRSCMSSRRPSFNTSTFGSPSFVDRTLSTNRAMNSPFYNGKTMFGGSASASALNRTRTIFPVDEAKKLAVRNSVQIKPINESTKTDHNHLSKTAKRILDVLETFSTPVMDARKIPSVAEARREEAKKSKNKPPVKGLMIPGAPGVPDLLRMKLREKLQDSTVAVRNVANTSKSALNTSYTLPVDNVDKSKPSGKIKNKITSTRDKNTNDDIPLPVVLPDVQLPISTLPKFDFSLPPPTKPTKNEFKFSSPISINDAPKNVISINNFKFSQPLSKIDSKISSTPVQFNYTPSVNNLKKKETKINGQNSIQPAEKLLSGSVMDVLGTKKVDKSNDLMEKFKPASGTWECSSCMVRNIPTAIRCVACETLKEQPKPSGPLPSFGAQFCMPTDKWECPVCMVRNDEKQTSCVACTTPKSGATEPKPAGFGNQFKPPADTWECSVCLIRNQSTSSKCVACETPKPGTSVKSTLVMPPETKTSSGFTDIIQKQQERWECKTCLIRNPVDKTVCMSCDTVRVGATPQPQTQFKFGIPSKQETFKFGIEKQETPMSGFKFGIETKTPDTNFKFGVSNTSTKSDFNFGVKPIETIEIKDSDDEKDKRVIVIDDDDDVKPEKKLKPSEAKTNLQTSGSNDTSSMFKFGTQPTVTTSGATAIESKPKFNFGGNLPFKLPSESSGSKPMFNIGSNSTAVKPFSFGATTEMKSCGEIPKPVTTSSQQSNSLFKFGKGDAAVAPTPAVFGQTTTGTFGGFTTPGSGVSSTTTTSGSTLSNTTAPIPSTVSTASTLFGVTSTPTTVSTITTPTFGVTTTSTQPFGTTTPFSTTSAFGGTSTFGATTAPTFGNASAPTFSVTTSTPSFGVTSAPTFGNTSTFNVTTSSTFGATSSFAGSTIQSFGTTSTPFGAPTTSTTTFGAPISSASTFGGSSFGTSTPQNGGFNFGGVSSVPNFKFGSSNNQTAVFGFGSNQVNSGATAPAPSGAFVFGSGTASASTTPFSPDTKPNFNFTGGSIPTFSTQQGSLPSSAGQPVRKIRKAIRRVQPR